MSFWLPLLSCEHFFFFSCFCPHKHRYMLCIHSFIYAHTKTRMHTCIIGVEWNTKQLRCVFCILNKYIARRETFITSTKCFYVVSKPNGTKINVPTHYIIQCFCVRARARAFLSVVSILNSLRSTQYLILYSLFFLPSHPLFHFFLNGWIWCMTYTLCEYEFGYEEHRFVLWLNIYAECMQCIHTQTHTHQCIMNEEKTENWACNY